MTETNPNYWHKYYNHILQIIPWEGTYTYHKDQDYFYFLRGLVSLLYNTFLIIKRFGLANTPTISRGSYLLFYYETLNQFNSLKPLMEHYAETSCILVHPQLRIATSNSIISLGRIYLMSLLAYPIAFWRSRELCKLYKGKMNKSHVVINAALAQAAWWKSYSLLKGTDIKVILVANDHMFLPVSLSYVARFFNIKTVYLQHASVSTIFPPLFFDFALLDGTKAKQVYENKNMEPFVNIELVGMLKADGYVRWRKKKKPIEAIGICVNSVDNLDAIKKLILYIRNNHPAFTLWIRMHPAMKIPDGFLSDIKNISTPNKETMLEFLKNIDLLIAGESSVHVEAAIMNIPSLYFITRSKVLDDYGFIKDKLVEAYFDKPEQFSDILYQLDESKDFTLKAKPYCSTIDTEYENRSKELVFKRIDEIIE